MEKKNGNSGSAGDGGKKKRQAAGGRPGKNAGNTGKHLSEKQVPEQSGEEEEDVTESVRDGLAEMLMRIASESPEGRAAVSAEHGSPCGHRLTGKNAEIISAVADGLRAKAALDEAVAAAEHSPGGRISLDTLLKAAEGKHISGCPDERYAEPVNAVIAVPFSCSVGETGSGEAVFIFRPVGDTPGRAFIVGKRSSCTMARDVLGMFGSDEERLLYGGRQQDGGPENGES